IAEGKRIAVQSGKKVADYLGRMNPDHGAFLIYTSGTTGNPKGVLLSNRNFLTAADIVIRTWALPERTGSTASFLPLCHIAEKLQNLGAGISQRYVVNYLSSIDKIAEEMPQVEPTLLLCVPRLWEKMIEGVNIKLKNAPPARRKLAQWAFAVGGRVAEAKFAGKMPNPLDLIQYQIADRLVLGKIRKALGLGAKPLAASGAAPLHPHVAKWFRQLDIEILECYGLSESAAVICLTLPGVECTGTVGKPVAGMEFKIAEDGEILARGDNIFLEYYRNDEETAKVLTKDGWLHTGDLGELDDRGMVRIRGRKREILKTSGGKMVAPLPIEEKLKEATMISQVCMVGDNRKYFSALITLSESTLKDVQSNGGLAKGEVVISDPGIMKDVQSAVDLLNRELASFEQIKRFTVLGREFSVVDGEMTPTLKMKRNVIEKRFQDLIDRMYN
ncbi:MAG: AMP-dependent synthetase/ligase, partial [Bdellovibrionota bacterium]